MAGADDWMTREVHFVYGGEDVGSGWLGRVIIVQKDGFGEVELARDSLLCFLREVMALFDFDHG